MREDAETIGGRKVATRVEFNGEYMYVHLRDGRTVRVPFKIYRRLREATPEQRDKWELRARGTDIRWEEIDEDLSVSGLARDFLSPMGQLAQELYDAARIDLEGVAAIVETAAIQNSAYNLTAPSPSSFASWKVPRRIPLSRRETQKGATK